MYAKSEITIANILAAAESLFLEKNYADVSMTEIADRAAVTKGALYHHFPSKKALYLMMLHADLQEKKNLFQRAAQTGSGCRDRLRALTAAFYQLPKGKQALIKLIRRDINIFTDPDRDELVRAYQAALPEQIEAIIAEGIRNGELASNDPRLLSWGYVALVEITLSDNARDHLGSNQARLDYVLDLFFQGAGRKSQ